MARLWTSSRNKTTHRSASLETHAGCENYPRERIAKKLGMNRGMCELVVGAPPGYLKLLAPLPEGVVVSDVMNSTHKFVQFLATCGSAFQK